MNHATNLLEVFSELDGFQIIEPQFEYRIPTAELNAASMSGVLRTDAPIRILLADDDADTRAILSHTLEYAGMEVVEARDGQEALETALLSKEEGIPFEVILLDLQMPQLDGYSVSSTLRYKGYTGPIIAITGRPISEDLRVYKEAGCDFFLVKSELPAKLPGVLRSCLSS